MASNKHSIDGYDRHVVLCYKGPETWDFNNSAMLSTMFVTAVKAKSNEMPLKTKVSICGGGGLNGLNDGDVILVPEMVVYRGLKENDVNDFVEEVLLGLGTWNGVEKITTSHVYICADRCCDQGCGLSGSVLLDKVNEEIKTYHLTKTVIAIPCVHIEGHRNDRNLMICGKDPFGKVDGHWYGRVTLDDVSNFIDSHVVNGKIVKKLWRSKIGFYEFTKEDELKVVKFFTDLAKHATGTDSSLKNFQKKLVSFINLTKFRIGAISLVRTNKTLSRTLLGKFIISDFMERDWCTTLKTVLEALDQLHDHLSQVLLSLMTNDETRKIFLQQLADKINAKAFPVTEKRVDFFTHLGVALLRMLNPYFGSMLSHVDEWDLNHVKQYLYNPSLRSRFTALNASSEHVNEWLNDSTQPMEAHEKMLFVCFILTARVLNLGIAQKILYYEDMLKFIAMEKRNLKTNAIKLLQEFSMDGFTAQKRLEIELSDSDDICIYFSHRYLHMQYLQCAIPFYRIMMIWIIRLVGGFKMPLPSTCPREFSCLPEHFVGDACAVLIQLGEEFPVGGEDFMDFLVLFMASPTFVKNPYLRGKMGSVLFNFIGSECSSFKIHPLLTWRNESLQYLVGNLLKLYSDIQCIDPNEQFDGKYHIRNQIIEVLTFLWDSSAHCNAWITIANEEGDVFHKFLHSFLDDTTYLLDKSVKEVLKLKEFQEIRKGRASLKKQLIELQKKDVDKDMELLFDNTFILSCITKKITAPFLLPNMVEKVTKMIYCFLNRLGSKKRIVVLEPKEHPFVPQSVLRTVVNTCVQLAQADTRDIFVSTRPYDEELFDTIADDFKTLKKLKRAFLEVCEKVKSIPEHLLDPLVYKLMEDPVKLPSGMTVCRSVITDHLRIYSTDPFTNLPLTSEMLTSDVEKKAEIEEFLRKRRKRES